MLDRELQDPLFVRRGGDRVGPFDDGAVFRDVQDDELTRLEFKGRGLRVNAVLPSIIDTPANRADMPAADVSQWVRPAELAAVICPRPYQIQQGRADAIGWWPLQLKEYERARGYYERLGVPERIAYVDHSGGHEICVEAGMAFLKRWLA